MKTPKNAVSAKKVVPLSIPAKLPPSHEELLKLRDAIRANARALRKTGQKAEAKELSRAARRVRKLERASRGKKAAPKAKALGKEETPVRKVA